MDDSILSDNISHISENFMCSLVVPQLKTKAKNEPCACSNFQRKTHMEVNFSQSSVCILCLLKYEKRLQNLTVYF